MSFLHQIIGYAAAVGTVAAVAWSIYRISSGGRFDELDLKVSRALLAGLYLEALLGLLIFLLAPARLTAPPHPFLAIGAIVLAQWGHSRTGIYGANRHRFRALVFLGAAVVIVLSIVIE